ncbi:MAG TPA: Ldh family oxidoreductase [Actinophytocola sp.]|jgi:uncharacterized oxidoreductase|nr:Ldh family oxidoreductase [Actinophytocola sp.]
MYLVNDDDLTRLAQGIYEEARVPAASARIVAEHQVRANLAGHDSHGIQLLPTYIERIDRGHIVPGAEPSVISETPTSLFVDGRWGFGPVVTEWTTRRAMAKARGGVAIAVIREQSHVGRLADYPLMAVREGFIAMLMCDSGQAPKQVAPFGGREARLGTNPMCIALPSSLPGPVFIDMATSAAAMSKLKVARARGLPVPAGWLVDNAGHPTTDPNDYFAGGTMLPLGGAEGHKGYGLSVAVETLAAILPGLGFGVNPEGKHNDGLFLLLVDPTVIRPLAEFVRDVDAFVAYLKQTPTAVGVDEIYYPGELEYRTELVRRESGIPVDESTWDTVAAVAARFGLGDMAARIVTPAAGTPALRAGHHA